MLGKKLSLCTSIVEAKKSLGLSPFITQNTSSDSVRIVPRKTDKGYIIFIANRTNNNQVLSVSVKVDGLLPELWNPETGDMEIAKSWKYEDKKTLGIQI